VVITVSQSFDDNDQLVLAITSSADGTTKEGVAYNYDQEERQTCVDILMNMSSIPNPPIGYSASYACAPASPGVNGYDRITRTLYDGAGQVIQVRRAVGTPLEQANGTFAYTPDGERSTVIDANGNSSSMSYDGFDRLAAWYFPSTTPPAAFNPSTPNSALASAGQVNDADFEQYTYDSNGNRIALRKRDGRVLTFTYDGLNRVVSKLVPAGCAPLQVGACPPASATRNVFYGYDFQGHELYARFDTPTGDGLTNTYDAVGRLTSAATAIGGFSATVSSTYDADGNRSRVTHPDGAYFDSTYDGADNFEYTNVLSPGGTTPVRFLTYVYDSLNRPVTVNPANSWIYNTYDGISRLATRTQHFYGSVGDVQDSLGYNPASQIITQARSNNAFEWSGGGAVSRPYAVNGLNQYTSAGAAHFSYDANGDLVSDGSSTFVYDAENRLVSASGAVNATLVYDPDGRLFQTTGSTVTKFLHDGDKIAAEYDVNNNILRRYMWGPQVDQPIIWDEGGALNCSGTRVLHADNEGSVIATADCSGNQKSILTYDEYGVPGASNSGRFQYTGQAWIAELGMYYYKARMYSPALGRFMQADSVGYKDDLNLYVYVGDDPLNGTDPTGKDSWLVSRAIYFGGVYVADHEFVVVADKYGGTPKAQFDYGPSSSSLDHPGSLVELHGTNAPTRLDDDKAWHGDPSSEARSVKLNASDAAVISAGTRLDSGLGTPDHPGGIKYSILPSGPNQANSNSAASAVANNAVQSEHPGAPYVSSPSGSVTPGSNHPFNQAPPPPKPCQRDANC
jgi:RHS repeat-associated protein